MLSTFSPNKRKIFSFLLVFAFSFTVLPTFCMPKIDVQVCGTVSEEKVEYVDEFLQTMPSTLHDAFVKDGAKYILDSSGSLTAGHAGIFLPYEVGTALGEPTEHLTPLERQNTVNVSVTSNSRMEMAKTHELGHWFDEYFARKHNIKAKELDDGWWVGVSNFQAFEEIWKEEAALSGFPSYTTHNTSEYFAEVFRYVYEDPSKLESLPKSKAFVERVIVKEFGCIYHKEEVSTLKSKWNDSKNFLSFNRRSLNSAKKIPVIS